MLASKLEKAVRALSAKERARLLAYERGELESFCAESVFAQARHLGR